MAQSVAALELSAVVDVTREDQGYWAGHMEAVQAGQSYKFLIQSGDETFERIDSYAREVTNSVGEGVIVDPQAFDWQGIQFELPPHNALVIYEMHVGSFMSHEGETGKFETSLQQLDHLKKLGINAVQIMPVAEVRQFIRENVMMWLPQDGFASSAVLDVPP